MSLFMNMVEHPEMFMNTKEVPTSNQGYFKYDSFSELLQSQKEVNYSLQSSMRSLKFMQHQQYDLQNNRWDHVTEQLATLDQNNRDRNQFEMRVMKHLYALSDQQKQVEEMLVNENQLNEALTEQVEDMIQTHEQFITDHFNEHHISTEQLATQVDEMYGLYQTFFEKVNDQAKEQTSLKTRMDNQEALMEKMSRQLTNFRSILYERTNDLAEKIEESYELTSSYVYQLLTGSAEPFSSLMINDKQTKSKHN